MHRIFCILVVVAGCGPSSYNEFRDQLTTRWCERQIRCGEVAGSDSAHCEPPPPLMLTMVGDVDVPTSMAAHHMTFHPDNAHECLEAVQSAPCDKDQAADDLYRQCHGVVTGAVDNGAACLGDDECIGGVCAGATCGMGVCTPFAAHGAPCVASGGPPDQTCDPSVMFCNVGRGVCEHKLPKGGVCAFDEMCLFDGVCVDGTCDDPPRVKAGDICTNGFVPCEDGYYCDQSCKPLVDAGQACTTSVSLVNACKAGMTCTAGACAPWSDVPVSTGKLGPLARCAADGDCAAGLFCASGSYCYYLGGVGAVCQADHECATGKCATTCVRPSTMCGPPSS
jgi:hypothetical protein